MTTKERLLIEVQGLTDADAAAVLEFIEQQKKARRGSPWPPSFDSIGRSGRSDLGARSEEILRAEFGSSCSSSTPGQWNTASNKRGPVQHISFRQAHLFPGHKLLSVGRALFRLLV
jgi:hypothetical protein